MLAGLDFPDAHLRQRSHEAVVESFLTKIKNGEYVGTKPSKGKWSEMYPSITDGQLLAKYVLQQVQVLDHFAANDPQNLSG